MKPGEDLTAGDTVDSMSDFVSRVQSQATSFCFDCIPSQGETVEGRTEEVKIHVRNYLCGCRNV